ncbi:MAG: vWA domain-containing protein [Cyclobacteriaceae bacterium]
MTWLRSFTLTEYIFILLFLVFYTVYLVRIVLAARKLNSGYGKVLVKVFLRGIYFILFMVAWLGPSFGQSSQEIEVKGKDMYIAVDLSASMNAIDVQPTRLAKVKYELRNIIKSFNTDRIGLIIFSSEAFVQSPLTFDQSALLLAVDILNSDLVPNTGTDFGPALKLAYEKLSSEESLVTQQKSKVIILISDGEDFGDNTKDITQEIENSGIKLFTLGVGSTNGSQIRVGNGFKKQSDGTDVITKINRASLHNLATQTKGSYFEINETSNEVAKLINTIDQIEGERTEAQKVDTTNNKYYYFLWIAGFLLLIDVLIKLRVIQL